MVDITGGAGRGILAQYFDEYVVVEGAEPVQQGNRQRHTERGDSQADVGESVEGT